VRLVVIGGGRFGAYHARQLLKAVDRGLAARVVVVDRDPRCPAFEELAGRVEPVVSDWTSYLRRWLPRADPADQLVPAPLAPHLVWEWLAGELRASPSPPPRGWGLPYERPGPGGELYLSAAGWTCPATCVEPEHCPALHAPRDWDLADMLEEEAGRRGYLPAVFRCLHFAAGVGTIPAGGLLAARDRLRAAAAGEVIVATSSRCHAAVGALRLGPSG
jgi:hypothetical protein